MALLLFVFALICAGHRSAGQTPAPGLEGLWQGALGSGANQLRLLLRITKSPDGTFSAKLDSVDQGSTIPVDKISLTGDAVRLDLPAVRGTFEGTLTADRSQLTGTWTQGGAPQPLSFKRQVMPGALTSSPPTLRPGAPLLAEVPAAPVAFQADGKTHLVYELHITNFGAVEVGLVGIETMRGGDAKVIAAVASMDLADRIRRPGVPTAVGADALKLGAGLRAIVFMWVTLDAGTPVPETVSHRIGFVQGADNVQVTTATVPVLRNVPVVGPPLSGGEWVAGNGPANGSGHRRAMIPIDGRGWIAQRLAIDWVRLREDGKTFTGDPLDNKNYRAYGSEVLAVADAVVATVKDGIPENVPGATSRAVPMTLETLGGNHIILDLGGGHFAFYAHLQPGSLRVKVGDRVKRGQVIALLGNSGNSTEPHLHFHVSDRNSPLASEGVPYALDAFEVQGKGMSWRPSPGQATEKRTNELPTQNTVVRFIAK
jgi:murein DD-endopeptidase MepM/ murein hydrolase activator NlpD